MASKKRKPKFDPFVWEEQFQDLLASDRRARKSWEALVKCGCDPYFVSHSLALSCDFPGAPGHLALQPFRQNYSLVTAKFAKSFANRLRYDRDVLVQLFADNETKSFVSSLDRYIGFFESSAQIAKQAASLRLMNPNLFLALLVGKVQQTTGRGHYEDIATLLDLAYLAHERECPIIAGEAVRKITGRFKKRAASIASWVDHPEKQYLPEMLVLVAMGTLAKEAGYHPQLGSVNAPAAQPDTN